MTQTVAPGATRRDVVVDPATLLSVVGLTCVTAVLAGHAVVEAVRPVVDDAVGTPGTLLQAVAFGCYLLTALAAFTVAEVGLRIGTGIARGLERALAATAAAPGARVRRRPVRRLLVRTRPATTLAQG